MSKLTEHTTYLLLKRYSNDPKMTDHMRHIKFHEILDGGHPINNLSQRRLILWGNHTHAERVLDQPTMTHSALSLLKTEHFRLSHGKSLKSKMNKNFPEHDHWYDAEHVHQNVNYKPKNPK